MGEWKGVTRQSLQLKSCDMFPMPLTLTDTFRLPGALHTDSSVQPRDFSLLSGGAAVEGDFHWNFHHFPFRMTPPAPPCHTFSAMLPSLPGSWPGRIGAPPPISHSRKRSEDGKVAGMPHLLLGQQ